MKQIYEVIDQMDKLGDKSCFHRVAVIYATANKVSSTRDLVELFEYIAYTQKHGQIDNSAFSNDKLNPKGGSKGTLDFIVAQINMRRYMLDVWLATVAVPDTTKATIRANLSNPCVFSSIVAPYLGGVQPALAWMKDNTTHTRNNDRRSVPHKHIIITTHAKQRSPIASKQHIT